MHRDYEALFIVKPDLSDEEIEKVVEGVETLAKSDNGSTIELSRWGKKRLAYAIGKQKYGFYALLRFTGPSTTPKELEQHFRYNENILKGMVVLYDGAAGRYAAENEPEGRKEAAPVAVESGEKETASSGSDS